MDKQRPPKHSDKKNYCGLLGAKFTELGSNVRNVTPTSTYWYTSEVVETGQRLKEIGFEKYFPISIVTMSKYLF